MQQLTLVIGNKNYSSWSLRPWLALKHTGAPFQEVRIPLYVPGSKAQILTYSPTGKVPCLIDGPLAVWDSLAICEYLAEKFPAARLWPRDAEARAVARAVSAEMHAGFPHIRNHLSMNLRRKPVRPALPPDALFEIRRVEEIWRSCRNRYGFNGPYLFGEFSIADAMYAPVAARFENYGIEVSDFSRRYMETLRAMPAMAEWRAAALAEREVLPALEM
jgi:glutathione S-transferase